MNPIIKANGYSIEIGVKALSGLSKFLENARYDGQIFILADENTFKYCVPELLNAVPELESAEIVQVLNGEDQKNIYVCGDIWGVLTDKGADKQSLLINLGGETICDMGAFVATTYMGGIDFIQLPTTLLAMVNVAVGNKAALNFEMHENHLYFSTKPQAVFVYPNFIDTLGERQILSGFAEMLSNALVSDKLHWENLKNTDVNYLKGLSLLIYQAILIRNEANSISSPEQFNDGLMYFGHKMGSALREVSLHHNKLPLLYGEALAIGVVCEAYLSWAKGLLALADLNEITSVIKHFYVPYQLPTKYDKELLLLLGYNKETGKKTNQFSLLTAIGVGKPHVAVDAGMMKSAISYYRKEFNNIAALN